MAKKKAEGSAALTAFTVAFKVVSIAGMIATPLLGVWVASSLAAFANARMGWVVASGTLLFPGLPLAWEAIASRKKKPHILTFTDRLVLRTLAINLAFIGILLAAKPKQAFVALSARGDWFLGDHHGRVAEKFRHGAFALAGTLEWLYDASREKNPYAQKEDDSDPKPETSTVAHTQSSASPKATVSAMPSASATPSSSAMPSSVASASSTPPDDSVLVWPSPKTLSPIVENMPADAEKSIESVGHYIADHEKDPVRRVRAIHDWVTDRIAYDGPAFERWKAGVPIGDVDANPKKVFANRTGVCAGYAQLMTSLGKITGDEIVYVVGNVRIRGSNVDGIPHAWNAARINKEWVLIDATWDAGTVDTNYKFEKAHSTAYLFTPPEVFGVSHFPDKASWQLREKPLSRGEFIRQPMLQPAFFARRMELVSPDRSQVTVAHHLDIDLKNTSTHMLVNFVPSSGGTAEHCAANGFTHVGCDLPTGTFEVLLFGGDAEYGEFEYLGTLDVNSR